MLSEKEFYLLRNILEWKGIITQRELSDKTGYSLGTINKILNFFIDNDYIDCQYKIKDKGRVILDYYKVDNAIILAAGVTSENNSILRNIPKGLYVVKEEVLIERMIKQLLDVGIKDIYVVVGFRMDQFFYLEQKYGVHLIVNSEYTTRNNNGSLYCVKDLLGNSYIIPNDEYFVENVFSSYEYRPYYASVYSDGRTKEAFVKLDSSDRIINVYKGGDSGWVMLGHCYMTREYSQNYISWLCAAYQHHETQKKFWEEIFYPHLREVPLYIRKYDRGIIYEFDELDELQGFDNQFINNINPEIYQLICRTFNVSQNEITDIQPIYHNRVDVWFRFGIYNDRFVFRYPCRETAEIINFAIEQTHSKIANELGVDISYIYEDRQGNRIGVDTEPIIGLDVDKCIEIMAKLKSEGVASTSKFDYREKIRELFELFNNYQQLRLSRFKDFTQRIMSLLTLVENDNWDRQFSHNNITSDKFRLSGKEYVLVDWFFSGINDKGYDIAGLSFALSSNGDMEYRIIEKFVAPSKEVRRHLYACHAIYHYYQFLLGIYYDKGENKYSNNLYFHWKNAIICADKAEELFAQRKNEYLTEEQTQYIEKKIGEPFVSLTPLLGGVTNTTYTMFSRSGKKYALRIPGKGTNEYINRKDEMTNISIIDSLGVMPQVSCADPQTGILIMDFIDNNIPCSMEDIYNSLSLQKICKVLYEVHTCGKKFNNEFDIPDMQKVYIDRFHELGGVSPKILRQEEKRMKMWLDYLFLNYPKELVPCHIDPKLNNFLKKGRKLYLIDWEYSGMADAYFELANFSLTNNLNVEEEKIFLNMYCKVSDLVFDKEKFLLYKFATDYLWIYWHLIKVQENEMVEYNEMSWKKRLARAKNILDELEGERR